MENVKIADARVAQIRKTIANSKKVAGVPIEELVGYLQCLERLAHLERHLYNLTSDGYTSV
jgi:hypothetical protein